jgi:DNA primase
MPYVPPELKQRIKREISIQRLAEARGIKLRRSGKELIGLCPFHQDRNPSLNIDPVQNVWHCKGACGEGGDVIAWVMRAEGISFTHAVELLKRNYLPSATSTTEPPPKISTVPKLPPLFQASVDDQKLLGIVVDYYHRTLKQTPGAQQYLIQRGLKSAEMVEHFRLGFSNRRFRNILPLARLAACPTPSSTNCFSATGKPTHRSGGKWCSWSRACSINKELVKWMLCFRPF